MGKALYGTDAVLDCTKDAMAMGWWVDLVGRIKPRRVAYLLDCWRSKGVSCQ